MFVLCFLLLLLYKHNVCTAIEENISRSLGEADDAKSVDLDVSSASTTNDYFSAETRYEERQSNTHKIMNWTKEELTNLLEQHGYSVKKGSEGWPLGFIADIAYYPEELLPEMGMLHDRRNLLATKSLWVDGDKETVVPYYYDTSSQADHKVFEAAVKTWADSTCIKFTKMKPNACTVDLGQAAVCVGNFGGCWSKLGKSYGRGGRPKSSQQMSVQPEGCEVAAAAHEFGHSLGLCHEMARADRDKYIHVLYHHIDIDLKKLTEKDIRSAWFQGGKCSAEQMYDAPKPYDPMSLMQYGTSDFAMEDQRPVYLHKNPHFQYMFDYHRTAGYVQSHYDYLVMNMGYKCVHKWKKSCEDSGKGAPKCKNYGYIKKDCKCACPKGFSGSTCGTKDGPMFPLMDRAKAMLDITKPGLVDMKGKGMHDENHNYPKKDFTSWQFIGVMIRSHDGTRISVDVAQNFETVKQSFEGSQTKWLETGDLECRYGIHVYVGHAEGGHMRVECTSSMVNNELPEYRTVLRSKSNAMDIMGVGGWATCYTGGDPKTTRLAMEFQFTISFLDKPEDNLSTKKKNPGMVGVAVDKAIKKMARTFKKNKVPIIIGLVVTLLLLVAVCAGGCYWWYTRKASKSSDGGVMSKFTTKDSSSEDDTSDSSD